MKHEKEIIKWAKCKDGTGVWTRNRYNDWTLVNEPYWIPSLEYIIDDEYAELRKAQSDGATILFQGKELDSLKFDSALKKYSIKEEFTPVLKRSIHTGRVICFTSESEGILISTEGLVSLDVGDRLTDLTTCNNKEHWEDVK